MPTETMPAPPQSGLDTAIKVLTIFKLLLQVTFYGLLVGATIWFLVANPLPKLIKDIQEQTVNSMLGK